jgi:hypothetical protein
MRKFIDNLMKLKHLKEKEFKCCCGKQCFFKKNNSVMML